MTQRFPEILAPVGGREQLESAVKAGADAVYLAGPSFGARSSAKNFSLEQLAEAIRYAHLHGVSVFVTVNTLILDSEMDAAMAFIDFLYRNDADAAIVQDIGLMRQIRAKYPDFPLHASTQMTFHNVAGVRYAKELGFTRVVLPREMNIEEIKLIAKEVDIELEVFIHGALCVSYSGMCLMSSYIGGRSGNRGSCAQPCRKKYSLYSLDEAHTYHLDDARVLSPKDLSASEYLEELLQIPKISLKIEGRLKDAYYVFNVVSAYKKQASGNATAAESQKQLAQSYNRGYTKGFLFGEGIVDYKAGEHTGHRGTFLGKVVETKNGSLVMKLSDDLSKGDEVQARFDDGSSVGARADKIEWNGKARDAVSSGSTVSIPFKHKLQRGTDLYKTYSAKMVSDIDVALHTDAKRWLLRMEVRVIPGQPAYLKANVIAFVDAMGVCDRNFWRKDSAADSNVDSNVDVNVDTYANSSTYSNTHSNTYSAEVLGTEVQAATGKGTDRDRLVEQFGKLGGTPFLLSMEESHFDIADAVFMPISEINRMRRKVVEDLTKMLERRYADRLERPDFSEQRVHLGGSEHEVSEGSKDFEATPSESESVQSESKSASSESKPQPPTSEKLLLPAVISSWDWGKYQSKVDEAKWVELSHVSQLAFQGLADKYVTSAYTVNVVNSRSVDFLRKSGVQRVEISPEIEPSWLDAYQEQNPSKGHSSFIHEISVVDTQSRSITLMRMAYCPVGAHFGGGQKCGLCRKYRFAIRDEKGVEFPLRLDPAHCTVEVLSPSPSQLRGKKMQVQNEDK